MEDLDRFVDAYGPAFRYAKDNDLMLHACAARVGALARGGSCLELGLGHGFIAAACASQFRRYVVVEGSKAVIEASRNRDQFLTVDVVFDRFETFHTEERFDVIIASFVLEHVDDPEWVLRRYAGFLRPGGQMFVAVPNGEALNRRLGHAAGLLGSLTELSTADRELGHQRVFTLKSLHALLERAGLRINRSEGLYLKPLTTAQLAQLKLSDNIYAAMVEVGLGYPELCVGILTEVGV